MEPSRRFQYFAATEPSRADGSTIHRLRNCQLRSMHTYLHTL